MSDAKQPLRAVLDEEYTEAEIHRTWRAVVATRVKRKGARAARGVAFAAFALLLVCGALFERMRGPGAGASSLPLTLADGRAIAVLEAPPSAGRAESLSDGSTIVLEPGAQVAALETTPTEFAAVVTRGRVAFHVKKGGPRHWSIDCGLGSVEVVGTRFSVEREVSRVVVSVTEGVVMVRSPHFADGTRRLVAGQAVAIAAPQLPQAGARKGAEPVPPQEAEPPAPEPSSRGAAPEAPTKPDWKELSRAGDFKQAYEVLGPSGIDDESRRDNVDELFLLADVARRSGHSKDATAPLSEVLRRYRGDPRAALAAFTLGRLGLDTLGQPAQSAVWLEDALALGLAGPLVEDARARLVEAHARAGDRAAAKRAAEGYEQAYPNGRFLELVRRRAAPP